MAGHTRQKRFEVAQRRAQVAAWYVTGEPNGQMAEALGVSPAIISQDLRFLLDKWDSFFIEAIDDKKKRELAKLDLVELEAWDAWRRSKTGFQRTTITTKGQVVTKGEQGKTSFESLRPAETRIRTEESAGNPRYLKIVLECIAQRRKILGLDTPDALDLNFNIDTDSGLSSEDLKDKTPKQIVALYYQSFPALQNGDEKKGKRSS